MTRSPSPVPGPGSGPTLPHAAEQYLAELAETLDDSRRTRGRKHLRMCAPTWRTPWWTAATWLPRSPSSARPRSWVGATSLSIRDPRHGLDLRARADPVRSDSDRAGPRAVRPTGGAR